MFGGHGATHDLSQRGVGRSGRESVRPVDWFCRNAIGPPIWECGALGFVAWVQCTNLCRVCVKSIDSRARGYGTSSESVTLRVNNNDNLINNNPVR